MSAPTIGSNLIASGTASGSTETFIEVVNGSFVRQFGLTNWNRLRLAMRYRWYETPLYLAGISSLADLQPNNQFYVGFCNGTGSIPGDQYIQNFIGICPQDGLGFSRVSFSGVIVYYTNYAKTIRITGNVKTDLGYANGGNYWYHETYTSSLETVFVDLVRVGTDNVTMNFFGKATNSSLNEYYPTANFLIDMMSTTPARSSYVWITGYTGAFAHNETVSGSLNSICVSWNRDFPKVQITDLYVIRLA